ACPKIPGCAGSPLCGTHAGGGFIIVKPLVAVLALTLAGVAVPAPALAKHHHGNAIFAPAHQRHQEERREQHRAPTDEDAVTSAEEKRPRHEGNWNLMQHSMDQPAAPAAPGE